MLFDCGVFEMRIFAGMFFSLMILITVGASAHAQTSPTVLANRIDALERQLRLMQRKVSSGDVSVSEPAPTLNQQVEISGDDRLLLADLSARLGSFERQLRQLNGRLEEFEYRQNQLDETVQQMRSQIAIQREQLLSGSGANPLKPTEPVTLESEAANPAADGGQNLDTLPTEPVAPEVALPEGTPAEQYAYAFSFVQKNDLDSGRVALEQFIAAHQGQALEANAKFWLGRIHMQQGNNTEAARLFLNLIEAHPNHEKRVDALVDLSEVLLKLDAAPDACNALEEFRRSEDKASERLKAKARRVATSASCDVF
jgi:TolA-binding protein